ncbi:unnamed protein product [Symbiodinium sp. CCMP2456]|nr:unnamed protein product [Symbiodinium sp. CCMP2456]
MASGSGSQPDLPSYALKVVPASRGGGGLFFLRSQKRDHEELGRGGGFNERQTATDLKAEHNSDDELYDEFGRKKRRKAKAAAKGPSKTEAPKAEADSKEEVQAQKQKEPGTTPPAVPEPSPTAASAARVIDPRPGKGAQKGLPAPGAPAGFAVMVPGGQQAQQAAQAVQAAQSWWPGAWPGAPFGKGLLDPFSAGSAGEAKEDHPIFREPGAPPTAPAWAWNQAARQTRTPFSGSNDETPMDLESGLARLKRILLGQKGQKRFRPFRDAAPDRPRLVAYNVCGFGAGFGDVDEAMVTEVYGKLREDLQGLKADIICLNEVKRLRLKDPEGSFREDSLEALAEDLEEMEFFFAHANPGYETFGNAILVGKRLQVLHCDSLHLEGGSVITLGPGKTKHIGRGCLSVCVEVQGKQFATLVTHWDHISEAERLRQAESFLSSHTLLSHDLPHLLVGDLNAMKRSDYTDQEWAGLEQRNALKGWAPPENSQALLALEREGYSDLGDSIHQLSPSEAAAASERSRWTKKEGPGPPIRIDYIYASKHFSDIGEAKAAFVAAATGSDHLPLVADILLT